MLTKYLAVFLVIILVSPIIVSAPPRTEDQDHSEASNVRVPESWPSWALSSTTPCPVSVEVAISLVKDKVRDPRGASLFTACLRPAPIAIAKDGAEVISSPDVYRYWLIGQSHVDVTETLEESPRFFVVTFDKEVYAIENENLLKL